MSAGQPSAAGGDPRKARLALVLRITGAACAFLAVAVPLTNLAMYGGAMLQFFRIYASNPWMFFNVDSLDGIYQMLSYLAGILARSAPPAAGALLMWFLCGYCARMMEQGVRAGSTAQ